MIERHVREIMDKFLDLHKQKLVLEGRLGEIKHEIGCFDERVMQGLARGGIIKLKKGSRREACAQTFRGGSSCSLILGIHLG